MTKEVKVETPTRKGTEVVPRGPTLFPHLRERLDEMMADVWSPLWPVLFPEERLLRMPPLDLYEEGGVFVVKAELPGMKREEIEVRVIGDELILSGRKEKEEKVERKDYRRLERTAGEFRRIVTLPAEVEAEKVTATYREGVLEVRAPRAAKAEPKGRKVEVG